MISKGENGEQKAVHLSFFVLELCCNKDCLERGQSAEVEKAFCHEGMLVAWCLRNSL